MAGRVVTEAMPDIETGIAAADLRQSRFRAVRWDTNGYVLAGAGDEIAGVLENNPNIGEEARVFVGGIHEAVSGGDCWIGTQLIADEEGRLVQPVGTVGVVVRAYYRAEEKSVGGDRIIMVRREVADFHYP